MRAIRSGLPPLFFTFEPIGGLLMIQTLSYVRAGGNKKFNRLGDLLDVPYSAFLRLERITYLAGAAEMRSIRTF